MKVFECQHVHLLGLVVLIVATLWVSTFPGFQQGSELGVATKTWLTLSVITAVAHQWWVLAFWRLELHYQAISRRLGEIGFPLYAFGFAVLILSRPLLLVILARANKGTLPIPPEIAWPLAGLLLVPVLYVFYSVARYFGFKRALGADHFDPGFRRKGIERRGSFGLVQNSMYALGLLFLWLPGLLWRSKAAMLAAAFQHSYIWIHYYTVELPDMRHIYQGAMNHETGSDQSSPGTNPRCIFTTWLDRLKGLD